MRKLEARCDALPPDWMPKIENCPAASAVVALCRLLLEKPDVLLLGANTPTTRMPGICCVAGTFPARLRGTVVAITTTVTSSITLRLVLELDAAKGIRGRERYSSPLGRKNQRLAQEASAEAAP